MFTITPKILQAFFGFPRCCSNYGLSLSGAQCLLFKFVRGFVCYSAFANLDLSAFDGSQLSLHDSAGCFAWLGTVKVLRMAYFSAGSVLELAFETVLSSQKLFLHQHPREQYVISFASTYCSHSEGVLAKFLLV